MPFTARIALLAFGLCCCLGSTAIAQEERAFQTWTNISYAALTQDPKDAYARERCRLDVYGVRATVRPLKPVIVWFHGGGLRSGSKAIPKRLKDQDLVVVAPNYRLFPKVKSPVYVQDAAAAVAWTLRNIQDYGGDPARIFVSGHSAGGYLTSMVGLDQRWLRQHKLDANQLAGLIPFSGHTITHFTPREEKGLKRTDILVDDMAPLAHIRSNAPPLILITGDREKEMLGRYEENAYMMRMMKVAGHRQTTLLELQGYGHNMVEPALPILINKVRELSTNISKLKIP